MACRSIKKKHIISVLRDHDITYSCKDPKRIAYVGNIGKRRLKVISEEYGGKLVIVTAVWVE